MGLTGGKVHDAPDIVRFTLGPFEQNAYLLIGPSGRRAALVDPGLESEVILDRIRADGLELDWILNTHGHLDHVAGNRYFKERTGARLAIHPADERLLRAVPDQARVFGLRAEPSPPPDVHLDPRRPLAFDGLRLAVLHTPGHTPGGVCLHAGRTAIVGDTLFQGSIGRTDLPGGNYDELIASIRGRLFLLPGETVCYPGHGPETTLADERRCNPFVSDRVAGSLSVEST